LPEVGGAGKDKKLPDFFIWSTEYSQKEQKDD
jgi:hypothetical protein